MNTNILKKCVKALESDKPDISYIKGMLETLIEMSEPDAPVYPVTVPGKWNEAILTQSNLKTDEEEIPEIARPGKLGRIN